MGKEDQNGDAYEPLEIGPELAWILRITYRARKSVLLEGVTGIGKSDVFRQVAEDLGIEFRAVDISLLEPPDLAGMPYRDGDRTRFAVPNMLPTVGRGILLLEELNRAEPYVQHPALQLLSAGRLNEYQLPAGWIVCAAVNPPDGDYIVKALDPAMIDRFVYLKVSANRLCWILWAQSNRIHPAVLALARAHERFLDEVSPRRWAAASDLLEAVTGEELAHPTLPRRLFHGLLPPAWVELLLEAAQTRRVPAGYDVERLLARYHNDRALRGTVGALRNNGRTDGLDEITHRLTNLVKGPRLGELIAQRKFSIQAFERLLGDLAGDQSEQVQEALGRNPAACDRIELGPDHVLRDYRGSKAARKVGAWLDNPVKHYRVGLLVTALAKHVEHHDDLPGLRDSRKALFNLGYFLWQIGPKWAAPLEETLRRHGIEPIMPDRPKRKPR